MYNKKSNCIDIEIRNYMESVHDRIVVTEQTRFVAVCRWIWESVEWKEHLRKEKS